MNVFIKHFLYTKLPPHGPPSTKPIANSDLSLRARQHTAIHVLSQPSPQQPQQPAADMVFGSDVGVVLRARRGRNLLVQL